MVLALNIFNNDLAGQHPISLFIEIEPDIKIAEVFLIEGIFTDAQIEGSAISLISLEKSLTQCGLHHLRRQLLLFADVVDQVAETGKKDESHRKEVSESEV